jgi:hypothetical protein
VRLAYLGPVNSSSLILRLLPLLYAGTAVKCILGGHLKGTTQNSSQHRSMVRSLSFIVTAYAERGA